MTDSDLMLGLGLFEPFDDEARGDAADIGHLGELLGGRGHQRVQIRVMGCQHLAGLLPHLADAEGTQEPRKPGLLALLDR